MEDVHSTVAEHLQRRRQRYTRGRRELVTLLLELDRPVTIPELLDAGAQQAQSSLYRNLAVLEQCGSVRRLTSVDDVARYELAEELTGHHHHLVCRRCGRVVDVELPAPVERELLAAVEDAGVGTSSDHGFAVESHHVELVGLCADCRR